MTHFPVDCSVCASNRCTYSFDRKGRKCPHVPQLQERLHICLLSVTGVHLCPPPPQWCGCQSVSQSSLISPLRIVFLSPSLHCLSRKRAKRRRCLSSRTGTQHMWVFFRLVILYAHFLKCHPQRLRSVARRCGFFI